MSASRFRIPSYATTDPICDYTWPMADRSATGQGFVICEVHRPKFLLKERDPAGLESSF